MTSKYNLTFISNEDLFNQVESTVKDFRSSVDLKKFNNNIIDPIKLLFDSKVYNKSFEEIIQMEVARQIDKSNNNHIGYFHQNIFNYIGNDEWVVPKKGFDIINEKRKIFVEMKNKHNTMNSSSSQKSYMKMQSKIIENSENQCLLVEAIATKSQNIPWETSLDGEKIVSEKIRRVSMDKFYEIVTGSSLNFYLLCEALPKVLDDVLKNIDYNIIEDTVLSEIKELYPEKDLLKFLYLLAFSTYEGFN